MNIALVVVLGGDLVRSTEHVGVGVLASYLRYHAYDVEIFEIVDTNNDSVIDQIMNETFDVIGFSTTCINMSNILEISKRIKKSKPDIHIVYGGHMATFWGEKILQEFEFVNFIVKGEGEITLYELLKALGKNESLEEIKGIVFRNSNNKIITNPPRELINDLDQLPYPARDQFEKKNCNFQYLRISTSRGCFGNCAFCSSFVGRKQPGPKWRGRSPKDVVDEIEMLVKKYNFHTYDFVDSTFEDPGLRGKERIRMIAEEIIDRELEIYYNCCFRAEDWNDNSFDRELLRTLVKSGLEKVNIGFESGNERGLRILNKNAKIEDNLQVIKLLSDFSDIYITFGFIMLHPYSMVEDLIDNGNFLYNTGIGQVIRHYFWQLEVYPGTLMEKMLIRDNLLCDDYDIKHGMYKYKFVNKELAYFGEVFKDILQVKSIWDFEIFDIIVHTFTNRLKRKYQSSSFFDKIFDFENFVNKVRNEMAEFNLSFFERLINNRIGDFEKEKKEIDGYINSKMEYMQNEQLKFGLQFKRNGIELISR